VDELVEELDLVIKPLAEMLNLGRLFSGGLRARGRRVVFIWTRRASWSCRSSRGRRILIADDLSFIRMVQRDVLTAGATRSWARLQWPEAVRKYRELDPDVVILDITMPEMNGLEAMQKILSLDPKARVLICSPSGSRA